MSFINLFLIGILIGTAMVIPGVSGAVIAVIFGVYDKMIYSLSNLFKNFKKHFIFLLVLGLGISIGAIWFSNIIMFLYKNNESITKFSFIGLILGGIPYLFKEIKQKNEKVNYIAIFLTIIISTLLWFISKRNLSALFNLNNTSYYLNFIILFLAGLIYSIGKVVPGISGSFLLISIGMYEYVLSVISHPVTIGLKNLSRLIPFIIGLFIGILALIKLMGILLKRNFGFIYSIIIGFVIGSLVALIPQTFSFTGILIMIFSFILSYKMLK